VRLEDRLLLETAGSGLELVENLERHVRLVVKFQCMTRACPAQDTFFV
jgi:hypothetical protein